MTDFVGVVGLTFSLLVLKFVVILCGGKTKKNSNPLALNYFNAKVCGFLIMILPYHFI